MPINKKSGPIASMLGSQVKGPKTLEESRKGKRVKIYTQEAAQKAQMQVSTGSGKDILRGIQKQNEHNILTKRLAERSGPKPSMSAKRSPRTYRGPRDEDMARTTKVKKDYEEAGTFEAKTPTINQQRILQRHASVALSSKHSPEVREEAKKGFHKLEKVAGVSPNVKMRPCAGEGCTNPVSFEHEDVTCASCTKTEQGKASLQTSLSGLNRSRR